MFRTCPLNALALDSSRDFSSQYVLWCVISLCNIPMNQLR
jgi:hypothetical protein